MATTTKTQTEIQSPVVYRITDKATHEHFYLVKSDSQANTYYQVRWNGQALDWQCNCPSRKPCKHQRAVQEVLKIRRAAIAAQMGGDTPAIVARMQAREDAKLAEQEATRYYPAYKAGSQWVRFSSRGTDVAFGTEQEASEYLRGVAGESRIETSGRLSREAYIQEFSIYE